MLRLLRTKIIVFLLTISSFCCSAFAQMDSPIQFMHNTVINSPIWHVLFTNDGKKLITTNSSHLIVWDLQTKSQELFYRSPFEIHSITISPDDKMIALGNQYKTPSILILDINSGNLLNEIKMPNFYSFGFPKVSALLFSVDGKKIIVGTNEARETEEWLSVTLSSWYLETGQEDDSFNAGISLPIYQLSYSPDSKYLFTGDALLDSETGELNSLLDPLERNEGGAGFISDDRIIDIRSGAVWEVPSGKLLERFDPPQGSVITTDHKKKNYLLLSNNEFFLEKVSENNVKSRLKKFSVISEDKSRKEAKFSKDGNKVVFTVHDSAYVYDITDLNSQVKQANQLDNLAK